MSTNENKATSKLVSEKEYTNRDYTILTWSFGTIRGEATDGTFLYLLEDLTISAVDPKTDEPDYVMLSCKVQTANWNGALPFYIVLKDQNKTPVWRSKDFNILIRCNEKWVFAYDEKLHSSDIFDRIEKAGFGSRGGTFFEC